MRWAFLVLMFFFKYAYTNVENVQTCAALSFKRCVPCEGRVSPYSEQHARDQLALLQGWTLSSDGGCLRISRFWRVKNFRVALEFLKEIGELSEKEAHHPDLHLTAYRNVRIDISTHAICGLSENDFILAAKINLIDVELKLDGEKNRASASSSLPSAVRRGKVHMLSGMISSGKSTYAKQLQLNTNAVLFSPDEWILDLYGAEFPVERFQEHGDAVKTRIWDVAQQLLKQGVDVVLDFSFWSKSERRLWREKAVLLGAEVQLYFFECPTEIMRQRLHTRNERVLSGIERHFFISEETFDRWIGLLEVAEADERAIVVDSCRLPN